MTRASLQIRQLCACERHARCNLALSSSCTSAAAAIGKCCRHVLPHDVIAPPIPVGFQPCGFAELITRIAAGHHMRHTSGCNQQVRLFCARNKTRLTHVAASTCEGIRCFLRHARSTSRRARKARRRATRRLRFREMKLPLSSCRFCASSFL